MKAGQLNASAHDKRCWASPSSLLLQRIWKRAVGVSPALLPAGASNGGCVSGYGCRLPRGSLGLGQQAGILCRKNGCAVIGRRRQAGDPVARGVAGSIVVFAALASDKPGPGALGSLSGKSARGSRARTALGEIGAGAPSAESHLNRVAARDNSTMEMSARNVQREPFAGGTGSRDWSNQFVPLSEARR